MLIQKYILAVMTSVAMCDFYSSRYDSFDITPLLENDRILLGYTRCFLDHGPCTPDAKDFKRFFSTSSDPRVPDAFYINTTESRNPPALKYHNNSQSMSVNTQWEEEWSATNYDPALFTFNPRDPPPGFEQQRCVWTRLNRIRTGHGKCGYMRHKWGWSETAACLCGCPEQTMRHIISDCPLYSYNGPMEDLKTLTPAVVDYLRRLDNSLI